MANTVRDIILEAASRANICPRKKALPDDQFTSCLVLFNGVMEEYSNRNYIEAYKNEIDFKPTHVSEYIGVGDDADFIANGIQLPKRALYKYDGQVDWTPMEFIAYDDFYSSSYSDYIVSWQPVGPNLYKLYFKPRFLQNSPIVKLIYNVEMKYNDNEIVTLPTPYIELITRALAYKISVKYPRLDPSKQETLKEETKELENSLKATNASMRIITRGGYAKGGNLTSYFRSGAFISDRYF